MTNYDILKEYEAHNTPVPSYEEWQAKDSQTDYLQQKVSVLESKNQQLKELLKECNKQLSEIKDAYIDLTTQDEYGSYYIDEAKLFVETVGKTIGEK